MDNMQFDFRPGTYRVINSLGLNVRGTMSTENSQNLTGQKFTFGKTLPIYRVISDKKGWIWGTITADNIITPQSLFVCLWDLNTVFCDLLAPFNDDLTNPVLAALLRLEYKIDKIIEIMGK
jgi:hypothetical protein